MKLASRDVSVIAWSVIATVWSTILSYRHNPLYDAAYHQSVSFATDLNDPRTIFATGGFPFKVYDYPLPPMGPGPEQSEYPLLLNWIFWLIASILVARLLGSRVSERPRVAGYSFVLAAASVFALFGYLLLKFD